MNRLIDTLFHSNNSIFPTFSAPHMTMLTMILGMVLLVVALQELDPKGKLRLVLLGIMVSQQIMLYSWYAMNNAFDPLDALPLYPCRISSLLCIWMLISWRRDVFNLLFFMGLTGAPLALLLPDTSQLGFPNVMFIQFFMGHAGILFTIAYLSKVHGYSPSKNDFFKACRLTLMYMFSLIPINMLLGSNYGYMASKPDMAQLAFLPDFPFHIPYFVLLMILSYSVLFLLVGGYKYLVLKTQ